MERVLNEDYKEAAKIAKEVALDASTRTKQVAVAATKACAFVEHTEEVLVAANLFKEGLQAAKDFITPTLRKFIQVVTNY